MVSLHPLVLPLILGSIVFTAIYAFMLMRKRDTVSVVPPFPGDVLEDVPFPFVSGPADYRDDHTRYKTGMSNIEKLHMKRGERTLLQDRLDKLTQKTARQHIGGGHVDMTQDTRGYYGVILS